MSLKFSYRIQLEPYNISIGYYKITMFFLKVQKLKEIEEQRYLIERKETALSFL